MIRWLRVVLPVPFVVLFVVLYGGAALLASYTDARIGLHVPEGRYIARGVLGFAAVFYGFWRALGFHPLFITEYGTWLATTPWTSRKPLPLGPIHLVPQDITVVGSMVLLAWLGGDGWALFVPQIFMGVYLLGLGGSLLLTGVGTWGYAVGFGMGVAVWLWRDVAACLCSEGIVYGIAYLSLRRSLALFPWDVATWAGDFLAGLRTGQGRTVALERASRDAFGWPFARLAPKFPGQSRGVLLHHALLGSLLAGWWVFALASHISKINDADRNVIYFLPVVVACIGSVARLFVYCDGYWPPISLIGRLATGRWIIPGYDQVFVAPLLAVAASGTTAFSFRAFDLDPFVCLSVGIAMVLFILLGTGPGLHSWRLTGNHRITPGLQRFASVKVG